MLDQETACRVFRYDPETGCLYRRKRTGKRSGPEKKVGSPYSNGYLRVSYGPRKEAQEYLLHRLIWMMQTGEWPPEEIDHINGDRQDNRWCNLRACSSAENKQNVGLKKNNTSGFIGVSYWKTCGKWRADITVNGKMKHLGRFGTPEEASAAYQEAKAKLHTFNPTLRETA